MLSWFRRNVVTGFFVTVPLAVSLVALVWTFRLIDGVTSGMFERVLGRRLPGLGILTAIVILVVIGAFARNVLGRRLLSRGEALLLQIPVFRTVYGPVKQLIAAFSPDNEYGFKQVVLVEDSIRGSVLGFLTKEFTVNRGHGSETMMAVYVPTNHLYLGDIVVCPAAQVTFPDLTVEQGIRVFLTGGMALPGEMRAGADSGHRPDFEVKGVRD
jgi:uncharacterized membrane protein